MNFWKSISPALLIMFAMLFGGNLIAQSITETLFEKADRIIKGSPLIFEGVIVDQTFYESSPHNCWTANRIQITRPEFYGLFYRQQ